MSHTSLKFKPFENPAGTKGFALMEYAVSDSAPIQGLFKQLGFTHVANHQSKPVELWKQGDVHFFLNTTPDSFASRFCDAHGPSVCGMGFMMNDVAHASTYVEKQGAKKVARTETDWVGESVPMYSGIGDNLLYLFDDESFAAFIKSQFDFIAVEGKGHGLTYLDHVTHNVFRGNMNKWGKFYEDLFNFKEIRYFDIEGKLTGLLSRAMTSPCGNIRIPINESTDDQSQIEEYLRDYKGEGIQHIALATDNIYNTVEGMKESGVRFLDTPDFYYDGIDTRLPGHGEDVARMYANKILIDGSTEDEDGGLLLQIFTETVIGPVFFEIIQRKGDEGFGEGNFKALFVSIEEDQIKRGVITEE